MYLYSTDIIIVKEIIPIRPNLVRLNAISSMNKQKMVFDAWDEHATYILSNTQVGDYLKVVSYEYVWPNGLQKVQKITSVINESISYNNKCCITNENNTRGCPGSDYICVTGKELGSKKVTYYYAPKNSSTVKYLKKGKNCHILGTLIRAGGHKKVMVGSVYWT